MLSSQNIHKLYLWFSIGFLFLLLAGIWSSFGFIASLYRTSIPVNSVIIVVVWGSICLALYYIIAACREIDIFLRFTEWYEDPENVDFDVDQVKFGFLGSVLKPLIGSIKESGRAVVSSSSETHSMVESFEQGVASRSKLITFLGGFLVLLGLLGTFLGLTITLQSMGVILSKLAGGLKDSSDSSILQIMIELITRLKEPMQGMGTAFSTSLFGLAGSAVVSIQAVVLSRVHEQLKRLLEGWLSAQVRLAGSQENGVAAGGGVAFPADGDFSGQMRAIAEQLAKNNVDLNKALGESNKFLLEMTIQQRQGGEVYRAMEGLVADTKKQLGLNNDLTGRLLKDTRQMVSVLESLLETSKQ
ncbi:MAG: hypothetical protein H0S85_06980 [Desulfovibrionaceae bacterium]|jgi:hypothetical protein|nr:hypothetical protein [Desulfovibrionaceae bacterium]